MPKTENVNEFQQPYNLLSKLGIRIFIMVVGIIAIWYLGKIIPKEITDLMMLFLVLVSAHFIGEAFVYKKIEKHFQLLLDQVKSECKIIQRETIERLNPIIEQSKASGITGVYKNRQDIGNDVMECVKKAENKVLILGIAFSEHLILEDLARVLKSKLSESPQSDIRKITEEKVKILLLNAYRSPSVFRAFLETEPKKVERIINFRKNKMTGEDPIFATRLFKDFETAYTALGAYNIPEKSIRFYAHAPTCWLVIADDTAFFQPYTFGKKEQMANMCLGAHFPVFKFKADSNSESGVTFEILEDHFLQTWLTSSWGMMHIGAAIQDKERLIHEMFESRMPWFSEVSKVLNSKRDGFEKDERSHPRQPCKSNLAVSIINEDGDRITATVSNFSCNGIALETPDSNGKLLSVGNKITIDASPGDIANKTSSAIRERLLQDETLENRKFKVERVYEIKKKIEDKKVVVPAVGCSAVTPA